MNGNDILSAPLTVNWSLSYRCNFTCRHCYSRTLDTPALPPERMRDVVELLADKGVVFVNFGGGEPLLVGELFDITAFAASRGIKVTMNSNGWLLDRAVSGRIRAAGFESVGISIDSPDARVHDRFRNMEGSFARAVSA
ncbi:MAG: radical SAM protein, partial [bacterium]